MSITLVEFTRQESKLPVIIRSIDMVGYQAEVILQDRPHLLLEKEHKPLRHQSLSAMREALEKLPVSSITLKHDSAYDEMVGQPLRKKSNTLTLEIPIPKHKNDYNKPVPINVINRLPCRGCTLDCSNYATCDGKPWRH